MNIEQEKQHEVLQKTCPWAERTPQQWRRLTTPQEAARLVYLAQQTDNQHNPYDQSWQNKWALGTAFETFWKEKPEQYFTHAKEAVNFSLRESSPRFQGYQDALDQVFDSPHAPNVYHYLQALRSVKVKEDRQKEKFSKTSNEQPPYLLALAEIPKSEHSPILASVQTLIETFLPEARLAEMNASVNRTQNKQEGQSLTQLKLVEAATHFFWETYDINPEWTIQRFIATLRASFQDSSPIRDQEIYPTDDEENQVEYFIAPATTENEALANIGKNFILDVVDKVVDKESGVIFQLHTIAGLTQGEIAKKLTLSDEFVAKRLREIKEKLRNNEVLQAAYPHLLRTAKEDMQIKGSDVSTLFTQSDEIELLFREKKNLLRPGDQEKLEALLAIAHRGKLLSNNDLISEIAKKLYPHEEDVQTKQATVRRSIARSIKILQGKEQYHDRPTQFRAQYNEQETKFILDKITSDPHFWPSLSAREQEMINLLYVNKKSKSQVAQELNLNPSTISRFVGRLRKRFGI